MARRLAFVAWAVCALAPAAARATTYTYLAEGTPLVYRTGETAPPADWLDPAGSEQGFTPSAAGFGIGYGDDDDRTVLKDMRGRYLTVYARAHFTVGDERAGLRQVRLVARFDDGFVAYLNGVEIARTHLPPGPVTHRTPARDHEASSGAESFAVDPALLRDGDNVFAVEVHNTRLQSSDLSFIPTLTASDAPGPGALVTLQPAVQQVGRTALTLCWETDVPAPGRVLYGPTAARGLVAEDPTPRTRHEVTLRGLPPGADCHWRIASASGPGTTGVAHTEPDPTTPWRMVAMGDTRSSSGPHARVIAGVVAADPRLVINTGDLVGESTPPRWRTFFAIEGPLLARAMLLPAIGNHEQDAAQFRDKFVLPADSPGGERYYVRRFAQVAVVTLDQYTSPLGAGSAQLAWLERTLAALRADPAVRFVFVQLHHGPFSSGTHGGNGLARRELVPLFERYHVDVVFSGHDHLYDRTTVNGVKYVVTAGGGAPLHAAPPTARSEARHVDLHYCLLEIEGATLHFRAFTPDGGTVLDDFWLGRDRHECAAAADCAPRPGGPCDAPDAGAWHCVKDACLWACAPPPPPPASAPAPPPPAPAPVASPGCGCGCRAARAAPLGSLGLLAAALALGRRRYRR